MWLVVILAVAAFLRLYALDRLGFNSDEAVYGGTGGVDRGCEILTYFPIYRAHPLLYQVGVVDRVPFVLSDFVGPAVVRAFGLAAIVVMLALGAWLYGRRAGLLGRRRSSQSCRIT